MPAEVEIGAGYRCLLGRVEPVRKYIGPSGKWTGRWWCACSWRSDLILYGTHQILSMRKVSTRAGQ